MSDLVGNPEGRFSHDGALINVAFGLGTVYLTSSDFKPNVRLMVYFPSDLP